MVRMYRDLAEQIFMLLLNARYNAGIDLGDSYSFAMNQWYRPGGDNQGTPGKKKNQYYARMVMDHGCGDDAPPNAEQIISTLGEMIKQEAIANDRADGDLIDKIVSILRLPHTRNVLTGRTLEQLRDALLLPEETSKFNQSVSPNAMTCADCKHRFVSNELVTIVLEDRNGPIYYCRRCSPATYTVCSKCSDTVSLDRSQIRSLNKECLCGKNHDEVAAEPQVDGELRVDRPGAAERLDGLAAAGRAGRRLPPPPAPPVMRQRVEILPGGEHRIVDVPAAGQGYGAYIAAAGNLYAGQPRLAENAPIAGRPGAGINFVVNDVVPGGFYAQPAFPHPVAAGANAEVVRFNNAFEEDNLEPLELDEDEEDGAL